MAAARYSAIDVPRGYPIGGQGNLGKYFYNPYGPLTKNLQRLSLGVGYLAKIHSQNNVFTIAGAASCFDVIRNPASLKGDILDSGSSINGAALDPAQCLNTGTMGNNVSWTIPYSYNLLPTAQVSKKVTVNAGAGRMAPPATLSR